MSIPPDNHSCWQRLAAGVAGFDTKQLALQLLFTRMHQEKQPPPVKAAALHAFFIKYERILGHELNQLKNLGLL